MIGEFSESHLLNVAKDVVEKKTTGSVLLDTNAEGRIPKFQLKGTISLKWLLYVCHSMPIFGMCRTHEIIVLLIMNII